MMKKLLCSLLFTVLTVGFVTAQYGDISGGSPLQAISTSVSSPGTNTPTSADGTDLGTVSIGNSVSQTYTFTNLAGGAYILGTTALSGDFSVNSPTPGVNVGPGATSTFTVTFTPTVVGLQSATVEFQATDGVTPETYYFQIQGTGGAATPELVVTGDDNATINHFELTTPGDNTDFGEAVVNSETVTRSFTLTNSGAGSLNISAIELFPIANAHFNVILPAVITSFPFVLNPGNSIDIDVEFSPTSVGSPLTSFISIQSDFSTPNFLYQVSGEGVDASPTMEVLGNGSVISSGDATPSTVDHTVFTSVDIADGGVTRTFTIENNGTADLNLTSLSPIVDITGVDAADFTITTNPTTPIAAGGSTTFVVTFDPTTTGIKDATIEIDNNGVNNPYIFDIQGIATDDTDNNGKQLLITQYYEGVSLNDNWIEIKNISATATISGFYNLAVFLDDNATTSGASNITNKEPDVVVSIPSIAPGGIYVYRRAGATLPSQIGVPNNINFVNNSEVCTFTGNDVIVISLSAGTNTFNDRVDILGVVGSVTTDWGTDKSLVKGCGTLEVPAITYSSDASNPIFNASQFIEVSLEDVNAASVDMNIALGTQVSGSTTWTSSWSNGVPDQTREVIVDGAYTNSDGTLLACDLTVNAGASVNLDSNGSGSNYVLVTRELDINGSMTIGDTEALVMTEGATVAGGQISKIEKTTPLNNFRDYTYWSAPVSTTIAATFVGVDPNRIWRWTTPSSGDTGNWAIASGSMEQARGYLAEAPTSVTSGQQHEVTFTGAPNNGPIGVSVGIDLTDGDGYGGYNIIGNPYPSAIDIDDFLENQANNELNDGASTDATIWLWTHGTQISDGTTGEFTAADYATYNLSGGVGTGNDEGTGLTPTSIIGSGQGFLIRVLDAGDGSVNFNNSMRVNGGNDTQFFKSSKIDTEKDRVWLNMSTVDGKTSNQTLVAFMDKATDGVDRGYDGLHLGSGDITFFSNIEDDIYAIQGLGAFNESKEVSLGFYAWIDGKHKVSIGKSEGVLADQDIFLVDNELGVVHDLKQGPYEFDVVSTDDNKERFTLKFNSGVLSTDDLVLNNSFIVYNEDGILKIKAGLEMSSLKVYDITGRLLIDSEPNSSTMNLPSQNIKAGTVLLINATMEDGSFVSKKAIKF